MQTAPHTFLVKEGMVRMAIKRIQISLGFFLIHPSFSQLGDNSRTYFVPGVLPKPIRSYQLTYFPADFLEISSGKTTFPITICTTTCFWYYIKRDYFYIPHSNIIDLTSSQNQERPYSYLSIMANKWLMAGLYLTSSSCSAGNLFHQ